MYVGTSEKERLLEKMEMVARERWYMLVIKAKFAGTLCMCMLFMSYVADKPII